MKNLSNDIDNHDKREFYVIRVDFNDGSTIFPVFLTNENKEWKEKLTQAVEFYRKLFENRGIISTQIGKDLYSAGVTDLAAIDNWDEVEAKLKITDVEKEKKMKYLAYYKTLPLSKEILKELAKDMDFELNKKLFVNNVKMEYLEDKESQKKILQALDVAIQAHEGQTNKRPQDKEGLDFIPYVNHPIAVAQMALKLKLSVEAIQAALLHDVKEDTEYSVEKIQEMFGDKTMNYINDVTKDKNQSREEYMKHVEMLVLEPKILKCLDRYHNLLRSFSINDPIYIKRYIQESEEYYVGEFKKNEKLQPYVDNFVELLNAMKQHLKNITSKQ